MSQMFYQARRKAHDGCPYEERDNSWKQIGANGLPGDLTWEEFVAASSRYRHSQNMAGTRPLELLIWSGENWLLPRAYVELLDRWAQREEDLADRARICSTCGSQGPYWGGWRTSTIKSYVTRCPPCSGAAFRPYTGHLRGVQYEWARRRGTRADDYLCRLCKKSQASASDHCHEHGMSEARSAAAATPGSARPSRTTSSSSKAVRCTSWSVVAASNSGPCRVVSTLVWSAYTWSRPNGTGVAAISRTLASWSTRTGSTGSGWCAAAGTGPAAGRRTLQRPRWSRWCGPSLARRLPRKTADLLRVPPRARGDRRAAASLTTASRARRKSRPSPKLLNRVGIKLRWKLFADSEGTGLTGRARHRLTVVKCRLTSEHGILTASGSR